MVGLRIAEHVKKAIETREPVVGMETSVFVQGLPREVSEGLFDELMEVSKGRGFHLAIVGILDGEIVVGIRKEELLRMIKEGAEKVGTREIPIVVAKKCHGATTVSATLFICRKVGIEVVVTGGIGGVHPGGRDISQDLIELANGRAILVCSGMKSILDVEATNELLETLQVPVVGYGTDEFPVFYSRRSGIRVPRVNSVEEVLRIAATMKELELEKTLLVLNPVPAEFEVPLEEVERYLSEVKIEGVRGKELTPYLLKELSERSRGKTLAANVALLKENLLLAGEISGGMARNCGTIFSVEKN